MAGGGGTHAPVPPVSTPVVDRSNNIIISNNMNDRYIPDKENLPQNAGKLRLRWFSYYRHGNYIHRGSIIGNSTWSVYSWGSSLVNPPGNTKQIWHYLSLIFSTSLYYVSSIFGQSTYSSSIYVIDHIQECILSAGTSYKKGCLQSLNSSFHARGSWLLYWVNINAIVWSYQLYIEMTHFNAVYVQNFTLLGNVLAMAKYLWLASFYLSVPSLS